MLFHRDLRLRDNPAWSTALQREANITPIFVIDHASFTHKSGLAYARLLAELQSLDDELRKLGGALCVRNGSVHEIVREFLQTTNGKVYCNSDSDLNYQAALHHLQKEHPCHMQVFDSNLLVPPGMIKTSAGHVPRVFGSFYRAWQQALPVIHKQTQASRSACRISSDVGDGIPSTKAKATAHSGEKHAHALLQQFVDTGLKTYKTSRDIMSDDQGTSGLSIALALGVISPHAIAAKISAASHASREQRDAFLRQLGWREWYAHLLDENPNLLHQAMQTKYDRIVWLNTEDEFRAWQDGLTGYPIVDAGMRQLRATGTMHNRVRMIVASFLVKDLLVDWRKGEAYFRECLLDADLAQNVGNWQWVAGVGPDAAPYFRIFNPTTQSKNHDPKGNFIRRWIPELSKLASPAIHAPSTAPPLELAAADVSLGHNYPLPIVEHADARLRALSAYKRASIEK